MKKCLIISSIGIVMFLISCNKYEPPKNEMKWRIDNDRLTIYGVGPMEINVPDNINNWSPIDSQPWGNEWNKITEIHINGSITKVEDYAFGLCNESGEISDELTLVQFACQDILYIGQYSFAYREKLERVDFLLEVSASAEICDYAFYECRSLYNFDVPKGVNKIGAYAFGGCESLEIILIPPSVEYIDETAFEDSGLKEIWGESGTTAEEYAEKMGVYFYDCYKN